MAGFKDGEHPLVKAIREYHRVRRESSLASDMAKATAKQMEEFRRTKELADALAPPKAIARQMEELRRASALASDLLGPTETMRSVVREIEKRWEADARAANVVLQGTVATLLQYRKPTPLPLPPPAKRVTSKPRRSGAAPFPGAPGWLVVRLRGEILLAHHCGLGLDDPICSIRPKVDGLACTGCGEKVPASLAGFYKNLIL